MRYLCIDRGDRRTGVATGSDRTGLASPVAVIEATSDQERLRRLREHITDHDPGALVVGLPLNMDGTEGPASRQARAFAALLEKTFDLPVHLADERLSSYAADQWMSQTGLTRGQKKARRDALAAAAILQGFLHQQQDHEQPDG